MTGRRTETVGPKPYRSETVLGTSVLGPTGTKGIPPLKTRLTTPTDHLPSHIKLASSL